MEKTRRLVKPALSQGRLPQGNHFTAFLAKSPALNTDSFAGSI